MFLFLYERGDTYIYKIIRNNIGIQNNMRGGVNARRRHGYQIELEKKGYNPMSNNSLPNQTVTTWNILPLEVVMAGSTKIFK